MIGTLGPAPGPVLASSEQPAKPDRDRGVPMPKPMSKPIVWFTAGLAVGAGAVFLIMRAREGERGASPSPSPSPSAAPGGPPPSTSASTPSPAPATATAPGPSARPTPRADDPVPPADADPRTMAPEMLDRWRMRHHGVSSDPAFWDDLPPDPTWDATQADRVRARLAGLGAPVAADAVRCRYRCCQIELAEEVTDRLGDELFSSVGLGFGDVGGRATSNDGAGQLLQTVCWRRDDGDHPDRAVERAALLARAADGVAACGRGQTPPVTLRVLLTIAPDGEVAKVDSNAADLGVPAAACAERALLEHASFAPDNQPTTVPLQVALGGP